MPQEMQTLNQALERAAGFSDCGLRILDRREKEVWLGWREVFERSARVAGGLRSMGVKRGETIGLFYPTGEEFFVAFFGVLLAGAVPAPLYPPVRLGRLAEYQSRTARMLQAVGIGRALADARLRRILGEALSGARCQSYTLTQLPTVGALVEDVEPDSLGLVQFSSGTTVDPKPVALTHQALMAQTTLLNDFWPDRPGLRHTGVSWLPLYHDMGLIGGVLTVLERPSVLTVIPPEVFVSRPGVWLRTLSKYRATISPAPNFAFGLCVEKIRDEEMAGVDLGCWQVALCGAETIVPSVLRAFVDRFSRWGLRPEALTPVYGLSEAALAVTFSAIETPFVSRAFSRPHLENGSGVVDPGGVAGVENRELVSVGRPLPGFEIEIREEGGEVLQSDRVGRIWTRGPSLMREYLNQRQGTAEVLQKGWLDTGDLGLFHKGELYITGRAKDILIVRGANHAPEEIEAVASELGEIRTGCCAAVGHLPPGSGREEVWLFVESRRNGRRMKSNDLTDACRRRVLARTGIALDRILVLEAGTLPRTSSGKIRRLETLRRHLADELRPPKPVTTGRILQAVGRSMLAHARQQREQNVR